MSEIIDISTLSLRELKALMVRKAKAMNGVVTDKRREASRRNGLLGGGQFKTLEDIHCTCRTGKEGGLHRKSCSLAKALKRRENRSSD